MRSSFNLPCHSLISHRAAITMAALLALALSSSAFCDEIHDAAQHGDLAKVVALLNDKPDLVFSKDDDGVTPLHWAARNGHKDVVELLLAHGAEVNAKDGAGLTPLHYALQNGHQDVAELLLAHGADVNAPKEYAAVAVEVKFKETVSDAEALWVLRSYPVEIKSFQGKYVFELTVTATTPQLLKSTVASLLHSFQGGTYGHSEIWQKGEPLPTDCEHTFIVNGAIQTHESLRQQVESDLPQGVGAKWGDVWPARATVFVPPVDRMKVNWVETFKGEDSVQSAQPDISPTIPTVSVEASAAISVAEAQQSLALQTGTARQKPKGIDVEGTRLPSAQFITSFMTQFYSGQQAHITLVKSDQDDCGEFFELAVDYLRGVITNPPYWEKLRFSIPIYLADKKKLRLRCILDGQYAPGAGWVEPKPNDFQDLEPAYTGALQQHANVFVTALSSSLKGGVQ